MIENHRETDAAAQAFADYVALGPRRSLRTLLATYCRQTAGKPPTKRLKTLEGWSVKHRWQERIVMAATETSVQALEDAVELDAITFLVTSERLYELVQQTPIDDVDTLLRIRASVRDHGASQRARRGQLLTEREIATRIAQGRGISSNAVVTEVEGFLRDMRA